MNKDNCNLIDNRTNVGALNSFNSEYATKAISLCPLLSKFQIKVVNQQDTEYASEVRFNENDMFSFYINKESEDVSSIYAEVQVNESLCVKMLLSDQELLAGLAHEVGHIITFFKTAREQFVGQGKEISSDCYACKMGLAFPLYTLIDKLIRSGLYSESQNQVMRNRLFFIKSIYL